MGRVKHDVTLTENGLFLPQLLSQEKFEPAHMIGEKILQTHFGSLCDRHFVINTFLCAVMKWGRESVGEWVVKKKKKKDGV